MVVDDRFSPGGSTVAEWGRRVEHARQTANMTVAELAEAADTTAATIRRIETGQLNPRDRLRTAIAVAVRTRPSELFPYLDELDDTTFEVR